MDLGFIRKYVERNPYTGAAVVDLEALEKDPSLRALLRTVWAEGYGCGADDIIMDATVEQACKNPYTV